VPGETRGHGCGHNLLGSASLMAAAAVKDWLKANGLPGRVRYYGCPAEEGGAAKGFMCRDGAFDDVDIAICWHPNAFAGVIEPISLANTRIDFSFTGRASHAAARRILAAPRSTRGADERRRELHARAHALRRAHPLRLPRCGRHRAERGAGFAKVRYLIRARTWTELNALVRACGRSRTARR
jgi:aminobenzoyl-glutamate utilization protein B